MDHTVHDRPREIELLLYCARNHSEDGSREPIEGLIRGVDWDIVINEAQFHRILPLLYLSLQNCSSTQIPEGVGLSMRRLYAQSRLFIQLQIEQLLDLMRHLRDRGIEAISFKGPILGTYAYGDIYKRRPGDIDLLIKRKDYTKVRDLLVDMDYVEGTGSSDSDRYLRYRGAVPFRTASFAKCNIDVHVCLKQLPFDSFPFSLKLEMDAVWSRSINVSINGETVRTLAAEDALLHLCSDGAKESWAQLGKLCDLAELIRSANINWEEVARRADTMNTTRILRVSLRLCTELLGVELPKQIMETVKDDSVATYLADRASNRMFDKHSRFRKRFGRTFVDSILYHSLRVSLLERPHEKALYPVFRGLRKLSKWIPPVGPRYTVT